MNYLVKCVPYILLFFSACNRSNAEQNFELNDLVGSWFYVSDDTKVAISYDDDGTFKGEMTQGDQFNWKYSGNWTLEGGQIKWVYNESSWDGVPAGTVDTDQVLTLTKNKFVVRASTGVESVYFRTISEAQKNEKLRLQVKADFLKRLDLDYEKAVAGDIEALTRIGEEVESFGKQKPYKLDLKLLDRATFLFAAAVVRIRGVDNGFDIIDRFPDSGESNQTVHAEFKMQKIRLLRMMGKSLEEGGTEYEETKKRIDGIYKELLAYNIGYLSNSVIYDIQSYYKSRDAALSRTYEATILYDRKQRYDIFVKDALKRKTQLNGKSNAAALEEFGEGLKKMKSDNNAVLNAAKKSFLNVINVHKDEKLTPNSYLHLGRLALKQERWAEGKEYFTVINKNRAWLLKEERAETIYGYGLCLEKLGASDEAIRVYNSVIAAYGSHTKWSSQALQRGFELAYSNYKPKNKLQAYKYLRKILFLWDNKKEEESPSGALGRMRKRLPEVISELGLSEDQIKQIDVELKITRE